jgi:predicted DNA-binding protein with PD1-like motif
MTETGKLEQPIRETRGELGHVVALRLPPGVDLHGSLVELAERQPIEAGVILSGLGSLSQVTLRNVRLFPESFPIQDRNRIYSPKREPLELLTLVGNISRHDGKAYVHAHIVVSSGLENGQAYGGHLIEGCTVFSTVEVIVAVIRNANLVRRMDPQTRVVELYCES